MTCRIAAATIGLVLGLVLTIATTAVAQVQVTRDEKRTLVQKDVGDERWAIAYNPDDRTTTGNVFFPEGGDPAFIWCETIEEKGPQASFQCYGADACPSHPCSMLQWSTIDQVDLPLSFFYPPGTPCQEDLGEDCIQFAGCCDEDARCLQGVCVTGDACQPPGQSCAGELTCCTGSCINNVCVAFGP